MDATYLLVIVIIIGAVLPVSSSQDSRLPLQASPGILLRDLLNGDSMPSPGSEDFDEWAGLYTGSESAGASGFLRDYDDYSYDSYSDDGATDDLLASLSERGIEIEEPSAHFLLDLYGRLQSGENLAQTTGNSRNRYDVDLDQADTVRSYTPKESVRNSRSQVTMSFELAGMTSRETTYLAELRLRPVDSESRGNNRRSRRRLRRIRINIYQNGQRVKSERVRVRVEAGTNDGFDVIEITQIIRDLTAELDHANDTRVEIKIRQRDSSERRRSRGEGRAEGRRRNTRSAAASSSPSQNDAMLVIYTEDRGFFSRFQQPDTELLGRSDDDAGSHTELHRGALQRFLSRDKRDSHSQNKNLCSRQLMEVDFNAIGWGKWIVHPKKFNSYQCAGKCTTQVTHQSDPTNHAILQSLMRTHYKGIVERPCCTPTKLSPLTMLYFEYGEILLRHHKDMVVDSCGCR